MGELFFFFFAKLKYKALFSGFCSSVLNHLLEGMSSKYWSLKVWCSLSLTTAFSFVNSTAQIDVRQRAINDYLFRFFSVSFLEAWLLELPYKVWLGFYEVQVNYWLDMSWVSRESSPCHNIALWQTDAHWVSLPVFALLTDSVILLQGAELRTGSRQTVFLISPLEAGKNTLAK